MFIFKGIDDTVNFLDDGKVSESQVLHKKITVFLSDLVYPKTSLFAKVPTGIIGTIRQPRLVFPFHVCYIFVLVQFHCNLYKYFVECFSLYDMTKSIKSAENHDT